MNNFQNYNILKIYASSLILHQPGFQESLRYPEFFEFLIQEYIKQ